MAPRSAAELMELWDALAGLGTVAREAALAERCLAASVEGEGTTESLGLREAALLRSFAGAFGARLRCLDDCPACGSRVAAELSIPELIAVQEAAPACSGRMDLDGWRIIYRLPTGEDLKEAAEARDEETAEHILRSATIREISHADGAVSAHDLPEGIAEALAERIEREDPLAAAEVALSCPDCGEAWRCGLDTAALFVARLDAWAKRTLWEVHHLAMRYGWREADILAMAPQRREAYLLMDAP